MVDLIWIKTLFEMLDNYSYLKKLKQDDLSYALSFQGQQEEGRDAECSTVDLLTLIYKKQTLDRVMEDFKDSIRALPDRLKYMIKLRVIEKKTFFEISLIYKCTLRNTIYIYQKAIDRIKVELKGRGYDNKTLDELLLGDSSIKCIYDDIKNGEENDG